MDTTKLRIINLHSASAGWMACYVAVEPNREAILIGLPVAVWALVEHTDPTKVAEKRTWTEIRAHVANRHGQVADYMSTKMTFLAMCPPGSDWMQIGKQAFDDYRRERIVAEAERPKELSAKDDGAPSGSGPN